jgi:hypothetical protein
VFRIVLKHRNDFRLAVDPRRPMPSRRENALRYRLLVGNASVRMRLEIARVMCQALPLNSRDLYLLDLASRSLCGYSDWLGEMPDPHVSTLRPLVKLARRLDWVQDLGRKAVSPGCGG